MKLKYLNNMFKKRNFEVLNHKNQAFELKLIILSAKILEAIVEKPKF